MSTGTRRQDHDRADAYDYVRQMINLELRQYARRLKASAEAHVDELYQRAALTGEDFRFNTAGDEALRIARETYFSADRVIEPPADAEAPTA